MDFSGTIEACDLKVGSCRQRIVFMKVCEYKGSRSFIYHIFPAFVCFVLYLAKISGERLQDHWSSGLAHLRQRLKGELIGYPWYIIDDSGLTLTFFTARSNWVICTFEWGKLLQSHLMEEILQKRTILTE